MSVLSEKVRIALYTKINVSAVLNLATGGVHHLIAPQNASRPFVIFQRQAQTAISRGFGQNLIAEDDIWTIKAVTDEDSSTTKEPQQLGEDILAAIETALGTSLTLAGGSETWLIERMADIPASMEVANDRVIFTSGFMLRVVTH